MTWFSTDGGRSRLAMLLIVATTGCIPLPIRHTELVTAEVTGTVREADGAPAAGIPVAVTASAGDMTCAKASARGITDSAGRFHLPAVHERKRILWFGLMENFGATLYRFCAGGTAAVRPPSAAAAVASTNIKGWIRGDSLDCIAWTLRASARVSCNGPINQHGMSTFGAWGDARDSGSYRLLLADEDSWAYEKRAVVQWVVFPRSNASAGTNVRSELEVPTMEPVVGVGYVNRAGRAVIRVATTRHRVAFELGAPGEMRPVPDR